MEIKKVQTDEEMNKAYYVRKTVFVDEQNVSVEEEIDEFENEAIHFIGEIAGNETIAASRLRFINEYGKLERICVLKPYRGKSYGKQIIENMEKEISDQGYQKAKLNAQTHAIQFYENLGYKVVSDEFMDAGIPHVTMIKELTK